MKFLSRLPLLAKVLVWLLLHLLLLALCFGLFINWQLGFGLDSLLSGSAGERMKDFGDEVVQTLVDVDQEKWDQEVKRIGEQRGLEASLIFSQAELNQLKEIPANVKVRVTDLLPPQPSPRQHGDNLPPPHSQGLNGEDSMQGPPNGFRRPFPPPRFQQGPGGEGLPPPGRPRSQMPARNPQGEAQGTQASTARFRAHQDDPPMPGRRDMQAPDEGPGQTKNNGTLPNSKLAASLYVPESRPDFLIRGKDGNGYWAGLTIHFPPLKGMPMHPAMILIHSHRLDGGGMFFDFMPWLRSGLAVLLLSVVFWTPFVWKITKYLSSLTAATDEIAAGRFQVSLPRRGQDELGTLGETIQSMAKRLDYMVSGQKRFLADAAHELCGPLARIRTGLGIMEARLEGADAASLQSIEADVAELAELVDEVLAFSRAGRRKAFRKRVLLRDVALEAKAREAVSCEVKIEIPESLAITTDPALVSRAIGNLIRNASIHAGSDVTVTVLAEEKGGMISLRVEDDGHGVPPDELPHLFQPFYRLDRSRSRESGGSGLGMAIVRTAIEACGGEVYAYEVPGGGLGVHIRLPQKPPAAGG